jgi:hypothetical protein
LLRICEEVEEEVYSNFDREVASTLIGALVTDRLRRVDQVAYVRFASVYRQFKTLEELVDEARAVIDAQRYDVPGQGRLFIEQQPRQQPERQPDRVEGEPEIPHEGNGGETRKRGGKSAKQKVAPSEPKV